MLLVLAFAAAALLLPAAAAAARALRDAGVHKPCEIECAEGDTLKIIRVVLTIAHLDHTPENCDDANLRAWSRAGGSSTSPSRS